jgi:serine/threonine protein kinase
VKKPSPRKITGDRVIYLSRLLDPPKQFGRALLCDFGSAVQGEEERNHNAQPEIYRSPEVMLMANWSYPADIWNLGVMVSRQRNSILSAFLLIPLKTDLVSS